MSTEERSQSSPSLCLRKGRAREINKGHLPSPSIAPAGAVGAAASDQPREATQVAISDSRQAISLSVIFTGGGKTPALMSRHRVVLDNPVMMSTSRLRRSRSRRGVSKGSMGAFSNPRAAVRNYGELTIIFAYSPLGDVGQLLKADLSLFSAGSW